MQYRIGDTVDKYQIVKILGQGSYGTVYEAVRTEGKHQYRAAIKVITISADSEDYEDAVDGLSEQDSLEFFKSIVEELVEECALMEDMKGDSHIVSYEDHHVEINQDGDEWTIIIRMELLAPFSKGYRELTRQGKEMKEKDVMKLGIDICRALETCEKKNNVIHRDIKPENIFVSKTGNYKLGDFGIAKVLGDKGRASTKKGTESYMAPEVYSGKSYDNSADIFSLGMMLYRMMNRNRPPFLPPAPEKFDHDMSRGAFISRMKGEKEWNVPQDASEEFAAIILKACEFDVEKRYRHPRDMRRDIEKLAGLDLETSYAVGLYELSRSLGEVSDDSEEGTDELSTERTSSATTGRRSRRLGGRRGGSIFPDGSTGEIKTEIKRVREDGEDEIPVIKAISAEATKAEVPVVKPVVEKSAVQVTKPNDEKVAEPVKKEPEASAQTIQKSPVGQATQKPDQSVNRAPQASEGGQARQTAPQAREGVQQRATAPQAHEGVQQRATAPQVREGAQQRAAAPQPPQGGQRGSQTPERSQTAPQVSQSAPVDQKATDRRGVPGQPQPDRRGVPGQPQPERRGMPGQTPAADGKWVKQDIPNNPPKKPPVFKTEEERLAYEKSQIEEARKKLEIERRQFDSERENVATKVLSPQKTLQQKVRIDSSEFEPDEKSENTTTTTFGETTMLRLRKEIQDGTVVGSQKGSFLFELAMMSKAAAEENKQNDPNASTSQASNQTEDKNTSGAKDKLLKFLSRK